VFSSISDRYLGHRYRSPINSAFDVLQHWIFVITGLRELRIFVGSEYDRVWSVDTDEAQLT
jgi:hypothetical protein